MMVSPCERSCSKKSMSFCNGKWSTLLIGPDVGSLLAPELLEPGQSVQFAFCLGASAKMRLQLNYWNGSLLNMDLSRGS
jgi:hypothetical protein